MAGLVLILTTSSASLRIAWLVLLWLNAMMRRMMVLNRMLRVIRLIEKLVVEILLLMIEFLVLLRSTALLISRFGRVKDHTDENKGRRMRKLKVIC
jgi:hypothetical protein